MLLGLQCAGQQPGAAIANLAAAVWQEQNWCIQPIGKKKISFPNKNMAAESHKYCSSAQLYSLHLLSHGFHSS